MYSLGILWSSQQKLEVLTDMMMPFTRLCSTCYLEGELKTLQNTFLSLGYPGKLVSSVITRARSSAALKVIGPEKPYRLRYGGMQMTYDGVYPIVLRNLW